MRTPHFSLRLLLVVVTVVAVWLGVQQVHRRRLMDCLAEFRAAGVDFRWEASWLNAVWLPAPHAWIFVRPVANGAFRLGPRRYQAPAAIKELELLRVRLNAAGVTEVYVSIDAATSQLTCRYFEYADLGPYLESAKQR